MTPAAPVTVAAQKTLGSLGARARAALPLGSIVLQPNETRTVEWCPQVPMRGPWWLGFTEAESLVLKGLLFGQESAFVAPGEVAGVFFDARTPERLVPIAGRSVNLGNRVCALIQNVSARVITVRGCLWGNSEESLRVPLELVGKGDTVSNDGAGAALRALTELRAELRAAVAEQRAAIDRLDRECAALRDASPKRAAVLEETERERMRWAMDRVASEAAAAPFEPSDVWATPADES